MTQENQTFNATEPWMTSYAAVPRTTDGIDYVITTVATKEFQLYRHEAEHLLQLLGAALGVGSTRRMRGLTFGEVADMKHGADRSDAIFARNVLLKFCRIHGLVLTDWDDNELAAGVEAGDDFSGCRPPMRHIAGVNEETLRRAAAGVRVDAETIADEVTRRWNEAGKLPPMAWDFRGFAADAIRTALGAPPSSNDQPKGGA
jgi:hypothetical protein